MINRIVFISTLISSPDKEQFTSLSNKRSIEYFFIIEFILIFASYSSGVFAIYAKHQPRDLSPRWFRMRASCQNKRIQFPTLSC